MSVIRTKTNMVCAYEPEDDDLFVQVVWHGPGQDSPYLHQFEGPPQPIEDYQELVDWAVGLADQMRFPLHVMPLRAADAMNTEYIRRGVANLTDQQRGRLRRMVVTRLAEAMRDCADPEVRADAYKLLVDMGVVER